MAYMGSQALALGVERTDLEPIVMKAEDGDPDKAIYHSVFITNSANDAINSIEDIKGRTMAFVDPDSTSGNLVPTAEIIKAFPDDNQRDCQRKRQRERREDHPRVRRHSRRGHGGGRARGPGDPGQAYRIPHQL